jgi:tetratricopeptide (TPR) repeat protein
VAREHSPPPIQPPSDLATRQRAEKRFGVLFRRGYDNYHAQRFAAAADDFQAAVKVAPHLAEGHYYLGEVYRKMAFDEKAEQCFRASLRQMESFDPAKRALCMVLHERGAYQEANEILQSMLKEKPDDSFVLGELAINCLALSEPKRAAELLEQFIVLTDGQAWGHAHLGRAHELQGDTTRALQSYREALRIDPRLAIAYHWLGLLLAREGNEAMSRQAFERYDRLRKLQNQEHDLNMALLRKADDLSTLVRLAQVRRALGKHKEALATLQRARQLAPNDPRLTQLFRQWSQPSDSERPTPPP